MQVTTHWALAYNMKFLIKQNKISKSISERLDGEAQQERRSFRQFMTHLGRELAFLRPILTLRIQFVGIFRGLSFRGVMQKERLAQVIIDLKNLRLVDYEYICIIQMVIRKKFCIPICIPQDF
jgi:hypothetical protein